MASHNQVITFPPRARTLANVLLDLRDARSDWEQALADAEHDVPGADDRMTEADDRIDALRDEFDRKLRLCTGLSWKQLEEAQVGCLL